MRARRQAVRVGVVDEPEGFVNREGVLGRTVLEFEAQLEHATRAHLECSKRGVVDEPRELREHLRYEEHNEQLVRHHLAYELEAARRIRDVRIRAENSW